MPAQYQRMLEYVTAAVEGLANVGIRISPRRARMISRSLVAGYILDGERMTQDTFLQILECSIPHAAWGAVVDQGWIRAAHYLAWDTAFEKEGKPRMRKSSQELDLRKRIWMLFGKGTYTRRSSDDGGLVRNGGQRQASS